MTGFSGFERFSQFSPLSDLIYPQFLIFAKIFFPHSGSNQRPMLAQSTTYCATVFLFFQLQNLLSRSKLHFLFDQSNWRFERDCFVWDCFVCFLRTILSGTVLSGTNLQFRTLLSGTVFSGTVLSVHRFTQKNITMYFSINSIF